MPLPTLRVRTPPIVMRDLCLPRWDGIASGFSSLLQDETNPAPRNSRLQCFRADAQLPMEPHEQSTHTTIKALVLTRKRDRQRLHTLRDRKRRTRRQRARIPHPAQAFGAPRFSCIVPLDKWSASCCCRHRVTRPTLVVCATPVRLGPWSSGCCALQSVGLEVPREIRRHAEPTSARGHWTKVRCGGNKPKRRVSCAD